MERYITDERTGLKYELVGDYYLLAGDDEPEQEPIGVWGLRRKNYLERDCQALHLALWLEGRLDDHLREVDQQAEAMFSQLVAQMAVEQGIKETLKATDQMAWVGKMSNIHAAAREIVEKELIYV